MRNEKGRSMNDLKQYLQEIKNKKKIALMTHSIIGYPSLDATIALGKTMAASGADMIELQIPFSDPLADGPTIMRACEASLKNGTKVNDAFVVMKKLTQEVSIPVFFMAYYNTVFRYGVERFCYGARKAGATGLIVPDMALDEEFHEHFLGFCRKYRLVNIQVISPASPQERLQKNAKVANGFVYCTARQGITGPQKNLEVGLTTYLENVKKSLNIPVAVGFGISKKEHICSLIGHADIAVIGSALIDVINKSSEKDRIKNVRDFLLNMLE